MADEAQEALLFCDPDDSARVRTLQTRYMVATTAISWLQDALQEAENAEAELE